MPEGRRRTPGINISEEARDAIFDAKTARSREKNVNVTHSELLIAALAVANAHIDEFRQQLGIAK